jgi:histone acetyltransferase (RNA polymerase elongator complex component)
MKKIIPIFVPHQGCRQRCIFCHQPNITGIALHTPMPPDAVRREIELALNEPKSTHNKVHFEVAFYGGTFTGLALDKQEQFLQTVQPYVDRGDLVGIRLSTHPAMFNERIFDLLKAFSVHTIELGIQSFHNDVLQKAGRGYTPEEAEHTVHRLQRQEIEVGIHLMIGLPEDSYTKSLNSAQKTADLHPASVRIHPTLVIQGTLLATLYRQGRYTPLSRDEAVTTCKDMLKLFRNYQIPVIRIGLQPTAHLEQHIIAGPYHPAIRQLVESAILYDEMADLCTTSPFADSRAVFYVSPKDVSTARGQKNSNIKHLQQQFGVIDVRIMTDDRLARGQIRKG